MKQFLCLFFSTFLTVLSPAIAQTRLNTDIVETAVAAGEFNTLVTAVTAANLVQTLKSPGPFTVFAPTDSAFAKLPAGTIQALLNNIPLLTKILTYHVVAGEYASEELVELHQVKTVQGQNVHITERHAGKGSYVYVNKSKILDSIYVKNGVIHVIDTVLMPE
jgi:uncharacterized surface protein with fasciclin (FAS1) repeats